jgi:copper(I)-binding protein
VAALAALPLLAACGAGTHSPQYGVETSIDATNVSLSDGIAVRAGYITAPADKGGSTLAVFTLALVTGSGDTLTAISSPVAGSVTIQQAEPLAVSADPRTITASRATSSGKVSEVKIAPTPVSQQAQQLVVRLSGVTRPLIPAGFYPVTLTFATAGPVTVQLPVLRSGAVPSQTGVPSLLPDGLPGNFADQSRP